MINVQSIVVGELAANCYIVTDKATGYCAVIDPGDFSDELDKKLKNIGYDKIKYIILTHAHFDHIAGVNSIIEKTGNNVEVATGVFDLPALSDSRINLSEYFLSSPISDIICNIPLHDGDVLTLGDTVFRIIHTPGHTQGSVCIMCGDAIFTGDTLFHRSHGRTDFPTGSEIEMRNSLKKLASLEGNYTIYPGHDDPTTLAEERIYNPYISGDLYDNIY